MGSLFKDRSFEFDNKFVKFLNDKIISAGFNERDFELISGDVSKTTADFVYKRPGAKISLLYLDVDLEKPTYDAMKNLWDRVSNGGIIVLDEYGYHQWSESLGVDRFCKEYDINIISLDFSAPTAYIKKLN
jgi:hypothetical protein